MSHSTFVRHFLICGLDTAAGLELEDAASGSSSSSSRSRSSSLTSAASDFSPLERSYKPKVLRSFPDMSDQWSNYNADALVRLILPPGLRFCTQHEISDLQYAAKSSPFVVTREDGRKNYGVAIVFYEEVTDTNICHAVHTLQKMYSTDCEGGTLKRADRLRPAAQQQQHAKVTSERSRSLPRHYQQSRLTSASSNLDLSSATYDYRNDTLYATKAIAVILSEPFVHSASQVLAAMHKYTCKSDYELQVLEGAINSVLHDVPIPSPGRGVRFWCLGDSCTISLPKSPSELPLFDFDLLDFLDLLGVENAVKLFVCALLEHQILVYSSDLDKLMLVCESVCALLYPFSWPHVYVPILPPNLENFLDAPVPYFMGLIRRTHDIELSKKGCVCIVDIDSGELDLPEELPEFPYEHELIEEIRNTIVRFGGKAGADILREHAIETRDILETSFTEGKDRSANNANRLNNEGGGGSDNAAANISDTMEQLNQMITRFESLSATSRPVTNRRHEVLRLNNALREVFCNRFAHMFLSFEHFVIVASDADLASMTPQQKETMQNFDKTSFLSDQKQSHLAFLSGFLETQMFTSFIDDYIARGTSNGAATETAFDARLSTLKDRFGESLVRTPTYECCDRIDLSDTILEKRLKKIEVTVTPQTPTTTTTTNAQNATDSNTGDSAGLRQTTTTTKTKTTKKGNVTTCSFPLLDAAKFETRARRTDNAAVLVKGDRQSTVVDSSGPASPKIQMLNAASPAAIAETNWKFVNQLLRECKSKTKRILLEKLGQEAVEWGHGQGQPEVAGFTGSEENMLVAAVCDLIERIWSHGLQSRHGKSSLWHFLCKFGRANEKHLRFKGTLGTQAYCVPIIRSKPYVLPDHARPVQVVIDPKRTTATFDSTVMAVVHNVSTIHEIKTEIGYARAWVRLALERKSLSEYLRVLVSDAGLLKGMYKRYGFLRCEDEREQALYYLQTLNTIDFSCFTNAYTKSSVLYQVLIFPSPKCGTQPCSANVWMHVVGSRSETKTISVPRGVIHFSFWAKNLGVITSLRLAHDNAGSNPNWLVEHAVIRNEFSGQAYKFTCGRWLGTAIDDGSCERYMVGYPVPLEANLNHVVQECAQPPQRACPATPIKSVDPENETVELQTMLGDAINRLIKFSLKSLKEKISYAHLMCGEYGLVHALINIFSFGFKSARLFGRNLCVWDFFLKVTMDFNQSIAHHLQASSAASQTASPMNSPLKTMRGSYTLESPSSRRKGSLSNLLDSPRRSPRPAQMMGGGPGTPTHGTLSRANQFRRMYTKLITRIETTCSRLGKDDKLQLFICLASHDKLLGRIVTDLTRAIAAQQLYEESSFLRRPDLSSFLSHILEAMEDISVPVDPAMKKTLEQHYRI